MNFAFLNIFYINNISFGVDNVNTINGMYSLTIMAEDFSNFGREVFISVSVTPENTTSLDYILRNYLILTLIFFSTSIFGINNVINFSKLFISIFVIFLCFCKAPSNSTDSDLKSCSKFGFYSSESLKLQENLNNVNSNTSLAYFIISKLRNKSKHFLKFYQNFLLLSGDIGLNPGPCQMQFIYDKTWEPLKTRGLHSCHLNVNSLFSKIDELTDITNYIKPAILGITESKLDRSITKAEVNINGYSIIRNDRKRNGGGVACYIRNNLCFDIKNIFSNSIEHVFFKILIPKVKPIAIGIFYRPPDENDFFNIFSKDFQQIDSKTNEIYLLGDFNINLLQNGKFILKENQSYKLKSSSSALVTKYKEFCEKFSLTEIIKEPTRITSSTSTLLDHIVTNSSEKVFQKGVTDVGISDHQLIYCTRKVKTIKNNMHNQIQVQSLKKYSAETFTNALKTFQFPN